MGFTETVPDAPEKFELWRNGRSEVFLLQPASLEVKNRWVKEIRNLLQSQFDQVKEQSTIHDRWKSTSALSSSPTSTGSQLRSRSQSSFSIASSAAASNNNNNNRYSNIMERNNSTDDDDDNDSDDGFDTEEFDSDNSDESPSNEPEQNEHDPHTSAQLMNVIENNNKDLPSRGTKYLAVAGYDAVENTEISFQEGDTLELLRVGQEGWWLARHTRTVEEGWVPAGYLETMAN